MPDTCVPSVPVGAASIDVSESPDAESHRAIRSMAFLVSRTTRLAGVTDQPATLHRDLPNTDCDVVLKGLPLCVRLGLHSAGIPHRGGPLRAIIPPTTQS